MKLTGVPQTADDCVDVIAYWAAMWRRAQGEKRRELGARIERFARLRDWLRRQERQAA